MPKLPNGAAKARAAAWNPTGKVASITEKARGETGSGQCIRSRIQKRASSAGSAHSTGKPSGTGNDSAGGIGIVVKSGLPAVFADEKPTVHLHPEGRRYAGGRRPASARRVGGFGVRSPAPGLCLGPGDDLPQRQAGAPGHPG